MAPKRVMLAAFFFIFSLKFYSAKTETWVKGGYWYSRSEIPSLGINSTFYTHLHCAFADVNSTSYELSLSESDEKQFSNFTDTVKQKNPSVVTLLSIGGGDANYSTFSSMVSNSSFRKSFIDSSIRTARLYGFQGLELGWASANSSSDMYNMGVLFEEWRAAIKLETGNSSHAQLILTAAVRFQPGLDSRSFRVEAVEQYLDWVTVQAFDYYTPQRYNFTSAHAALYDPTSNVSTDYGISAMISRGLSANKMVLGLPFYGYAWTLANPAENGIGAPATGPAIREGGAINYKDIRDYVLRYGANVKYNATYVVNYCSVGSTWIGFDDVEVVRIKVAYAKKKKLLGYTAWEVSYDDNWILSQAAAQEGNNGGRNKQRLLATVLSTTAVAILLLGCFLIYYFWIRKLKSKANEGSKKRLNDPSAAGDLNSNAPNLITYNFHDIEVATDRFSFENKLGQGGYGPVYKALLPNGQEVAVKKLSKTSTQGYEEFRNEVMLTAKLQHVNLVRLLGFCTDREEQMLIYKYMPNKSLDYYLFDPIRRYTLDWRKRVHIIEGITQGLLYLQEYSRLTIIHRDLKASNVLLDEEMRPKISDFGMARIFAKDELEANTGRVVGTYGYVPPEYVKRGIYSTKSDVYSFGVLVLQIISGNRVSFLYGAEENLSLLDYAYELWKENKGMEFMDPSLDDTDSSCKLLKCLQIALLCVQENPNDRPSMLGVFSMLKHEISEIMSPKKPAFSKQADEDRESRSTFNDATISEVGICKHLQNGNFYRREEVNFDFWVLLALDPGYAEAQTWIRAGYYIDGVGDFPISGISISRPTSFLSHFLKKNNFPASEVVKQKNPSVVTLLSIWGTSANYSTFSLMVSDSSYRNSFIDLSIKIARLYGFQGLDLFWLSPTTSSDMLNAGVLLREWRVATELEARNSSHSQLILTARLPWTNSAGNPVGSIQQYLNWVHVPAVGYWIPEETNFTSPHAALYDPKSVNTDELIKAWIVKGLSANKFVLCLPYFGFACVEITKNE
ncbi:uncharacterized protein LOC116124717 [Pistacia vera]|uniref:uncharacterized protein LOC116124717 n=1 Tax=Pistacia vera TaxID=55513 RepID=UPI001263DC93|nr:uncharacterized protein LOC116124717 [Pistacia vera]